MKKFILLTALCAIALLALAQPQFSKPHGLYEGTRMVVSITASDPEASIRYTTDGSEPTAQSTLYTKSLTLAKTTILRAVEVKGDTLCSPIATASYIFVKSVLSQPNNPDGYPTEWGEYTQIWGTAVADYEMDPEMTEDETLRPKIIEGLKQLPILSIVTDKDNLFSHENDEEHGGIYIFTGPPVGDHTGDGWTRPAIVELFGGSQQHDYSGGCGLRLHGGHGRLAEKNPKHSFRLVFKEKYGKKTMKYPLFGEDEPAKFDQLVLRCHFGNAWQHWGESNRQIAQYTRDVWARRMQRKMGHTAINALYVHLFLNGMYWGLYNIAERVDDQYGKDHLGGKKSDIDIIKIEEEGGNHIEASEGTLDAWNLMTETVAAIGHAPNDNDLYEQLDTLLDIGNFIDYMLINQYAGNTDWDHHNWYAIRRHNNDSVASEGFRFLCWDSEIIFVNEGENVLRKNNGDESPTGIFQNLLRNEHFARRYLKRAKEVLTDDGLLGEESVVAVWDSLYNNISMALYDEAARWGDYRRDVHQWQSRGELYTVDEHYMNERNRLLNDYFPVRTDLVLNSIINYINVDEFEAPDDWVALTADLWHEWDGTGADAQVINANPGAELRLNATLNSGSVVAGFNSVSYILFADVSQYDKLIIRGSGGRLRILANRLEDHGDFKEISIGLNDEDPYWDADLQAVALPLSELRDCNTQRENAPRRDAFTHINAIKVESGSATVSGLWLTPAQPTDIAAIHAVKKSTAADYYSLSGQRVTRPTRGIYVKNGRKVVLH